MDILQTLILWVHIIAGYMALLFGTSVMIMRKGNSKHVRAGTVFFYCMVCVGISSVVLSLMIDSQFLLHIGIFAFFLSFGGWRSSRDRSLRPGILDILNLIAGLINGIVMLWTGHIILMVFGGISSLLVLQDLHLYYLLIIKKVKAGNRWLARHIGMMTGAYISAFTAFLIVNIQFEGPAWILWLTPTFVFVPLMQYWTYRYTKGTRSFKDAK